MLQELMRYKDKFRFDLRLFFQNFISTSEIFIPSIYYLLLSVAYS